MLCANGLTLTLIAEALRLLRLFAVSSNSLRAAIEGLRRLKAGCEVELVTDSEYLKNGITYWIHGWKRKGWMTAANKPVVNQDLWRQLDEQAARHKTTWSWTKGHASHADNNRCDELATIAARDQSCSPGVTAGPPAYAGRKPPPDPTQLFAEDPEGG